MKLVSPTPYAGRLLTRSLRGCIFSYSRHTRHSHFSHSNLPTPQLDYKSISENVLSKSQNALNRKSAISVDEIHDVAHLYDKFKFLSGQLNQKLAARNRISDTVKGTSDAAEKKKAIQAAQHLKTEISDLKNEVVTLEEQLSRIALLLPNDTHPDSPVGSEESAVTLSVHGPEPLPATTSRDHVHIAKSLNLLELDAGSSVTGSSWYYLINESALLELAVINYSTTIAMKHGFKPVIPPDVVKADLAMRCGFQPRDKGNVHQMYHIASGSVKNHPDLVLSGTAEIPLGGLFANKVFEESELPLKVVGIGKAFRAEAGARGTDTHGLYRVHQFTKVELFAVASEGWSNKVMEEMKDIQVEIMNGLNIPFCVLDMPTEDLGASAFRKYDIKAWMPGRGKWGETSSLSNCTDYQSRRLHIRYQPSVSDRSTEKHAMMFAHTLNGTAAAIPRLIIALLENGARLTENGEIAGLDLPSALKPFWIGYLNLNPKFSNLLCDYIRIYDFTSGGPITTSLPSIMATALARQAISALNREKPHSSITDWIEILTSSSYEVEAYDGIPEIVDSINLQASGSGPAEASRSIRKKLKHGDTHHQLRALVILKALVENCGTQFQTSFANDRLTEVIRHLAADPATDPSVKKKLLIVLASWKHQFQDDPKMKLVTSLFDQCKPRTTRRSEDSSTAHAEELAAKERELAVKERERELEREEAKRLREEAKLAKERTKKEEKERKLKEAKRPKRRAFNLEQEKPQVLNCIATASQCSSNLVNALMLANPLQEPVEVNSRVQECLTATKKVRKELVRYIQLVENEELIGALLETNERIVQALDTYDKYLIPDSSNQGLDTELSKTTLAEVNTSVPELTKLQEKQRAAVARIQKSRPGNVHPDLQELSFGALGSDAARLPPPIRPSSPDSLAGDYGRRGSLSDFSSYESSGEENERWSASETSPGRGEGSSLQGRDSRDYSKHRIANYQPFEINDSDPFADPV